MRILLACLLFVVQGQAQILETQARISFSLPAKKVSGTLGGLRSESQIDRDSFPNSQLRGSVSLESLKTGNFLRDWHLMAEKYFNRKKQDRLRFTSTRIESLAVAYRVTGELSIRGITREVGFEASFREDELLMEGSINIADWEMPIVRDYEENVVQIQMILPMED